MTPLYYAAINNSKDIFKILISKGANINVKDLIVINRKVLFKLA